MFNLLRPALSAVRALPRTSLLQTPVRHLSATTSTMSAARVTKPAPDFKGEACFPNGEFKEIKLSDYKVRLFLFMVLLPELTAVCHVYFHRENMSAFSSILWTLLLCVPLRLLRSLTPTLSLRSLIAPSLLRAATLRSECACCNGFARGAGCSPVFFVTTFLVHAPCLDEPVSQGWRSR